MMFLKRNGRSGHCQTVMRIYSPIPTVENSSMGRGSFSFFGTSDFREMNLAYEICRIHAGLGFLRDGWERQSLYF